MPTINGGRVTTDGSGAVAFKAEATTSGSSTSSLLPDLTVDLNLGGGVKTVKGRNLGSGKAFFAGSNGAYDVLLDFKSLVAGPGVTLTEDQNTIKIDFNADQRRISFLNLYEAPLAIQSFGLLYGTNKGTLEFAPLPTVQNSVLSFNGVGFVWAAPTSGTVKSVTATGDNAIIVTGGPITTSGTLALALKNTAVTPGTYNAATITVDAQGRITGAVSGSVGETNAATNVGTGAKVFAGRSGSALSFKSIKGFGPVQVIESDTEITIGASLGVTSVGLTGTNGLIASSSPVTSSGTLSIALSNTGVTAGTYNSVTVDATGRVTAATNVAAPVAPVAVTAANVGTGDGVFQTKVGSELRFKSIIGAGALQVLAGANSITLRSDAVTSVSVAPGPGISVSGDTTILTTGTVRVGLANSGVTPGTYTNAQIAVDATGRLTAVANGTVETITASNQGTGTGLFAQKAGSDLQFRTLKAGSNVSISQAGSEITIAATIPAASSASPTLAVSHNTDTFSQIDGLTFADGFTLTSGGSGKAVVKSGLTFTDAVGGSVPFTSKVKLVGISAVQDTDGAAILSAVYPFRANSSVFQGGNLAVSNPTSLNFVGATVTQSGSQANITIPPASLVVTSPGLTDTSVYADVRTLKFSSKFVVASTANPGEITIDTPPAAAPAPSLTFATTANSAATTTPTHVLIGNGLILTANTVSGTVTLSANTVSSGASVDPTGAVTLSGDQIVNGLKTFNATLTANADMVVGRNLTVQGISTFANAVVAQSGLTVTGNSTLNGATLVNGDATVNGRFLVKTPDTFFADINVQGAGQKPNGTIRYDQMSGYWGFYSNGAPTAVSGQFVGALTGNADTATKLNFTRTFEISGDGVAVPTNFDGTGNVNLNLALAATGVTAGDYTFPLLTVDAKGRITAIASQSGSVDLQNVGGGVELASQSGNTIYLNTLYGADGVLVRSSLTTTTISLDTTKVGTVKQVAINGENGIVATGSPITSSGIYSLALANTTVAPGTYANPTITVDQTGRVTMASTGNAVSSSDTAENIGTGDAHLFAQKANGVFQFRSLVAGDNISLTETGTTVTVKAILPPAPSSLSSIQVTSGNTTANATTLSFQGATVTQGTGNTAIITVPGGTVTSVSARGTQGVNVTGGPVTGSGTFEVSLANTGVTPGTFNYATITVDAQGRITAASQNATPTGSAGGTVTSISVASPGNDLVVSGSPITTSGTINLGLANTSVTAGSYGDAATVSAITVDAKGRLTQAAATPIAIPSSAVTDATANNTPSTIVRRDASGNFTASTITAALAGNASTATKLATARNIGLTSDVVGSASFDGSGDITISAALSATAVTPGSYTNPVVTVDQKGRVTSISNGVAGAIQKRHSDVVTVTNAATTTYSFTYNSGTPLLLNSTFVIAYLNRQLLRPTEFTVSGNQIVVSYPLNTGDELEIITTA